MWELLYLEIQQGRLTCQTPTNFKYSNILYETTKQQLCIHKNTSPTPTLDQQRSIALGAKASLFWCFIVTLIQPDLQLLSAIDLDGPPCYRPLLNKGHTSLLSSALSRNTSSPPTRNPTTSSPTVQAISTPDWLSSDTPKTQTMWRITLSIYLKYVNLFPLSETLRVLSNFANFKTPRHLHRW